jgi:YidC/Oxa1 family membrane protein insertase
VDQRRFVTWLMLTTALFFIYMSMRQPPIQNQPPKGQAPAVADANQDPLLREPAKANPAVADPEVTEKDFDDKSAASEKIVTLGSMDPAKGYQLQIAISTRGGAMVRAEAVEQKKPGVYRFRALEHDGGYLGYLALRPQSKGVRIMSVPDGSPAALATCPSVTGGLLIDDVLTQVDQRPIDSDLTLQKILLDEKPGASVKLSIERQINGQWQPLEFTARLGQAPMDVLRTNEFSSEIITGNLERASCLTTLASLNGTRIPTGRDVLPALQGTLNDNWQVHPLEVTGGQGVEFRLPLAGYLENTGRPSQIELVKRYRLLPKEGQADGYMLDLETVVVNRNEEAIDVSLRQHGVSGLTLEGWWYSVKISPYMFAAAGQRDVTYATEALGHNILSTRAIVDYAKKAPTQPDKLIFSENEPEAVRSLKYIGLDAQYFNASILPHPASPNSLTTLRQAATTAVANVDLIDKTQLQATNVTFWFDTSDQRVQPGGELIQRYQLFIGPKDTALLESHGLELAIEYGWFPWVAKPLSWILHFFYAIVRNYGVAIIMLTVLVRGLMFPLGRNAALSAQRMQEMQPELKKINELYKDNMEKRGRAMQELYKKHNFRPLAGCLPLFIQLPIFIGLYRCLSVDISLRQEPLLPGIGWCSNLAGPDMLLDWSSWMPAIIAGRGPGWFGPYLNVLPLITVALFLVQQKVLMPKATDEQTQMTQNMMQIMTIFMGVMFFKVPSGLCIYFITSSIWSLVERKLIKHLTPSPKPGSSAITADGSASSTPAEPTKKKKLNDEDSRKSQLQTTGGKQEKAKTRFEELRAMLDKPVVRSATQRDSRKDKKRRK